MHTQVTNCGVALLLLVGTVSKDMAQGNMIGTIVLLVFSLFNGFFVNNDNISPAFR